MTTYEKIQTLFKRDKDNKFVIMPGAYSRDEFSNVTLWEVTEKIDGMNVRVFYDKISQEIEFTGRTGKSILSAQLRDRLEELFTIDKFEAAFDMEKIQSVLLYGEGYGPKIQKGGGKYRADQSFILFDILTNETRWMEGSEVTEKADKLGIDRVPVFGTMTIPWIVSFVKSSPLSLISEEEKIMEGVVCRSVPLMLTRYGERVIFKLKVKDYEQLERMK